MIANLTRGAKTASLHLPADRFQIAGVLSYLGVDRLDDYELLCEGQDSSGIMVSLEPTGIAERNIAELCRSEKISLGRLNSGFRSLFKLPYEQQLGVMDRIASQKPEHFDDFRKTIDAATVPSIRQEYYFPLTVNCTQRTAGAITTMIPKNMTVALLPAMKIVTPHMTPKSLARRMSSTLAVSINNFIQIILSKNEN